jgi:hypothetical protein
LNIEQHGRRAAKPASADNSFPRNAGRE